MMLNCLHFFLPLFLSEFLSLAQHTHKNNTHAVTSFVSRNFLIPCFFFCLLGRAKARSCSDCGLAWLFLSNGALMSAMLMRNYQKLIKIKKGPKVKDLLITVPCKSPIIREHESEPNTAKIWENAPQDCIVHSHAHSNVLYMHTHSAHTSSGQCTTLVHTLACSIYT